MTQLLHINIKTLERVA